MKDSHLLTFALVTATLGTSLLYFLSASVEVREYSFSEAKQLEEYDAVKIGGEVLRVVNMGNLTLLTLTKPEEIEVVFYQGMDVPEGAYVEVVGEVSEYKGKRQVTASKVVVKE